MSEYKGGRQQLSFEAFWINVLAASYEVSKENPEPVHSPKPTHFHAAKCIRLWLRRVLLSPSSPQQVTGYSAKENKPVLSLVEVRFTPSVGQF
jgi:hypothetical protein